jgi:hypothetical protein
LSHGQPGLAARTREIMAEAASIRRMGAMKARAFHVQSDIRRTALELG